MEQGSLSREEIRAVYNFLLGREPESEFVVEDHIQNCPRNDFIWVILGSREFAERFNSINFKLSPLLASLQEPNIISVIRRLEHLSSLGLPLAGKSVTDVGCGVGHLSSFFLDRKCSVNLVDSAEKAIDVARAYLGANKRYNENASFHVLDFDAAGIEESIDPRAVTLCYDTLWLSNNIRRFLTNLAEITEELLVLETRCSPMESEDLFISRDLSSTDANGGEGLLINIPTRSWLWSRLKESFPYVYATKTQPHHAEFPVDWTSLTGGRRGDAWGRAVFVASREPLACDALVDELGVRHERCG